MYFKGAGLRRRVGRKWKNFHWKKFEEGVKKILY